MALGGALGLGLGARDARDAAPGVALIALGGALGLGLGARDARDARDAAPLLCGRRGRNSHPPCFHVALPHIYCRFAWQAWYTRYRVARLDLVKARVTPVTPRQAGVAQTHIHLDFTWQAWHNLTSTVVCVSSEELNAQVSPRTDDEYNLPYHEDALQEH